MFALAPGTPAWFLLAAFANDALKALTAAVLVRWLLGARGIRFDSLRDFWIYLATAVIATPALSGIGGAASWVARGGDFWPTWQNWFFGDAIANLVFTPLLLCLAADWRTFTKARPVRYVEAAAVFSVLIFAVRWS